MTAAHHRFGSFGGATRRLNRRSRLSQSNHTNRWGPERNKIVWLYKPQFMKRLSNRWDECMTIIMFITSCAATPSRKHWATTSKHQPEWITLLRVNVIACKPSFYNTSYSLAPQECFLVQTTDAGSGSICSIAYAWWYQSKGVWLILNSTWSCSRTTALWWDWDRVKCPHGHSIGLMV